MRIKMTNEKTGQEYKFLTLTQAAAFFKMFGYSASTASAKTNIKNVMAGKEPRADERARHTAYGFDVKKIN